MQANKECSGQCAECKCDNEAMPFDYIAQAHVTASDKFYGERVGFQNLAAVLTDCIINLRELDKIKKSLFYGKGDCADALSEEQGDCADIPVYVGYDYEAGRNIIHAVIGVATESGEMLEALHATLFEGKSFDAVNMDEEAGDVFWYMALLAKACGFDFEASQRKNIAKLRMRYGEKFSEFDANNRNLKAERSILEAKF